MAELVFGENYNLVEERDRIGVSGMGAFGFEKIY
jgi:hypothetical protein